MGDCNDSLTALLTVTLISHELLRAEELCSGQHMASVPSLRLQPNTPAWLSTPTSMDVRNSIATGSISSARTVQRPGPLGMQPIWPQAAPFLPSSHRDTQPRPEVSHLGLSTNTSSGSMYGASFFLVSITWRLGGI